MSDEALRSLGIGPSRAHQVIAVGWATVELDRAARDVGKALGTTFVDVDGSIHLGCACRRSSTAVDGVRIVLLEPTTEGRLAATLARHGEGWAVVWFARDDHGDMLGVARWSAARDGPFGSERLALGGPLAGPHRLLVETATIAKP